MTKPEVFIVGAARTPIGRAYKGALADMRPDDLAAQVVRAALDQVPELDPASVVDLMLGCGAPGGEQGFNMGRVVATLLGLDTVPGTTITRYCASSVQTARMAMHAIAAGEGYTIVDAAGVRRASAQAWEKYWQEGAAVDFTGSTDPRAARPRPRGRCAAGSCGPATAPTARPCARSAGGPGGSRR